MRFPDIILPLWTWSGREPSISTRRPVELAGGLEADGSPPAVGNCLAATVRRTARCPPPLVRHRRQRAAGLPGRIAARSVFRRESLRTPPAHRTRGGVHLVEATALRTLFLVIVPVPVRSFCLVTALREELVEDVLSSVLGCGRHVSMYTTPTHKSPDHGENRILERRRSPRSPSIVWTEAAGDPRPASPISRPRASRRAGSFGLSPSTRPSRTGSS